MKFSLQYVKQNPVMFGAIFLVFGVFVWFLLNHNANSQAATSTQVYDPASDPNVIAAQTQYAMASLSAGVANQQTAAALAATQDNNQTQVQETTIAAQVALAQTQADANTAALQTQASLDALHAQLNANVQMNEDNNNAQIGYATLAYDNATQMSAINAALQENITSQTLQAEQTNNILSAGVALKSKGIVGGLMNQLMAAAKPTSIPISVSIPAVQINTQGAANNNSPPGVAA